MATGMQLLSKAGKIDVADGGRDGLRKREKRNEAHRYGPDSRLNPVRLFADECSVQENHIPQSTGAPEQSCMMHGRSTSGRTCFNILIKVGNFHRADELARGTS